MAQSVVDFTVRDILRPSFLRGTPPFPLSCSILFLVDDVYSCLLAAGHVRLDVV